MAGHSRTLRAHVVRWVLAQVICKYHILSKLSSSKMSRNFRHFVVIKIGLNKMAKGDKHLDYTDETLQWMAKVWSVFVRKVSWRLSNSQFEQQFEAIMPIKTPGARTPTIDKKFICSQELANEHMP